MVNANIYTTLASSVSMQGSGRPAGSVNNRNFSFASMLDSNNHTYDSGFQLRNFDQNSYGDDRNASVAGPIKTRARRLSLKARESDEQHVEIVSRERTIARTKYDQNFDRLLSTAINGAQAKNRSYITGSEEG